MKKQIEALVKSFKGEYRLNCIATLRRWTTDAIGDPVDMLVIEFDNINNRHFGNWRVIESRDYEGIISECEEYIMLFLTEAGATLTKELKNGYNVYD